MLLIGFTSSRLLPLLPKSRRPAADKPPDCVVTVTIGMTLILATIISDSPDREKRFVQARGTQRPHGRAWTIVGFYFGSSTDGVKGLDIAPVSITKASLNPGEKTELATFVSGGKAPYSYK